MVLDLTPHRRQPEASRKMKENKICCEASEENRAENLPKPAIPKPHTTFTLDGKMKPEIMFNIRWDGIFAIASSHRRSIQHSKKVNFTFSRSFSTRNRSLFVRLYIKNLAKYTRKKVASLNDEKKDSKNFKTPPTNEKNYTTFFILDSCPSSCPCVHFSCIFPSSHLRSTPFVI